MKRMKKRFTVQCSGKGNYRPDGDGVRVITGKDCSKCGESEVSKQKQNHTSFNLIANLAVS